MKRYILPVFVSFILDTFASIEFHETSAKQVTTLMFALRSQLLPNILSKELCSCIFVTGAYERFGKDAALQKCVVRANLPVSAQDLDKIMKVVIVGQDRVEVQPKALAEAISLLHVDKGVAIYHRAHPEFGCSLSYSR